MKTFVKILSMLIAVIMLTSVGIVGITAYAEPTDTLGEWDFGVRDNPYADIEWYKDNDKLHAFKSSTHAHTVRSDADIELNDTIWYHYMKGYEALCLTDHGTVNGVDIDDAITGVNTGARYENGYSCGWTENQDRCALYSYQSFVHGNIDEITKDDYYAIIQGLDRDNRPQDLVAAGRGMFNMPLGNEANEASTNKCHVNTYNVSIYHGSNRNVNTPQSTVQGAYNEGAYTHINHVGEWTDGNGDPSVYSESWVSDYALMFTNYCPNRDEYTPESDTWNHTNVTGQRVKRGVIGMELVNTSDNRTRNDRFYVYDASLKILAPQGINVYGFCEDDSHEESDVDKNAQYFLINDGTAWSEEDKAYYGQHYSATNNLDPWVGYTGDLVRSMTNGEFYACSVNSKNSYELGDGFVASGAYPSLRYFHIDEERDQVILTVTNSSKVRLVADGNIVATRTISESDSEETVIFDLNQFEDKINNYIRIYMTGKGGIAYLQPILLTKSSRVQSYVQFELPSSDTKLTVYDANGSAIVTEYTDNVYILPVGTYSYTATRKGHLDKTEEFQVTEADIQSGTRKVITVTLEKDENINQAFFYVPETIYLAQDNKTFLYYIDRENRDNGDLIVSANKTEGNVYFHRKNATNIEISATFYEGATTLSSYALRQSSTSNEDTISTQIYEGSLSSSIADDKYVLLVWKAEYNYEGKAYTTYTYSYVYPSPDATTKTLSAGSGARTKNTVFSWMHSTMTVVSSVFVYGVHEVSSTDTAGYKFAPYAYTGDVNSIATNDPYSSGAAYRWGQIAESSGGSESNSADGGKGYIYADASRINGFEDVPLFTLGMDINSAEECTGENGNETYMTLNMSSSASTRTFLNERNMNNLEAHHGKRVYWLDNAKDNNYTYSFDSVGIGEEISYKLIGVAQGSKESRTDTVTNSVEIIVIKTDKTQLRTSFNDAVSSSYQQDWFETPEEYEAYVRAVVAAGRVLGDPTATQGEIDTATRNLNSAEDGVHLKESKARVRHFWIFNNETGEIETEDYYNYTLGRVLVANSIEIPGYDYAKSYKRFANGKEIITGTADFESITAVEENYEWIFYYRPETYDISYVTNTENFKPAGGLLAIYGQDFTITPTKPSRPGYAFSGWYLDLDPNFTVYSGGETIKYDYMEGGVFHAKWTPHQYSVTYDTNGGSFKDGEGPTDEDSSAVFDSTYTICTSVPERVGYHFAGWKVNGGDVHSAGSQFPWDFPANGTLVAQWSNTEYEVTYDTLASDATVSPEKSTVKYDLPYGTLATANRTGYTYEWYADPNLQDSALVTPETIVKIPVDHTLYAKWTPIVYTINYNLDGGFLRDGNNKKDYTVETDTFQIKNPEKTGYTFAGWSGTGISSTSYETRLTIEKGSYGNRTYTAHWTPDVYKITYNLNIDESSASQVVNDNPTSFTYADAFTIKPPVRTGYNFEGWSSTDGTYTKVKTIDVPANTFAKSLEFNASWTLLRYNISYDLGGGTLGVNNPSTYDIENGAVIGNPVRTGYTFYGWQSSAFDSIKTDLTIEPGTYGDIALTAVWSSDEGEIIYELNGGDIVGNNPKKFNSGEEFAIISPTKAGYTFTGWTKFHVATGNMEANDPENVVGRITKDDYGTIVFTATWDPIIYDITYDLDGGHYEVASPNKSQYSAETATFTLVNPIKEGYIFAGWSGSYLSGNERTVIVEKGSIGNRSYKAHWNAANYTISYDFAGGASTPSCISSYNFATPDKEIGAPVRTGYTFTGWTQTFHNFTWKSGELDATTGYYKTCDQHYLSSPILVRSGYTYIMNSGGNSANITAFLFDENRVFQKSVNVGELNTLELPNEEFGLTGSKYFIYFVVTGEFLDASYRDTITIRVVNPEDQFAADGRQSIVSVPQGSTGNFMLTASWSLNEYKLTYDLDGGALPEGKSNPTSFTVETPDITLINPTKKGFSFLGWEYDGSTTSTVVIRQGSTDDRDYKAIWKETMYTIEYKLDGGSVENANPATYYSSTPTFTLNNPVRTGYTFSGWTGTDIVNGISFNVTIPEGSTGNRTYTATWTPDVYNILYTLDGGTNVATNPNTYTFETDTFTLAHPTKPGALFSGWTGTGLTSPEMTVTISKGSSGDRSYTANWTVSNYSIVYNLAGGTDAGNPITYTVDSEDIYLKAPTRTGYVFSGWTGTGLTQPTEHVTITKGSTGNRNYTATWTLRSYNINYTLGDDAQVGVPNPTSYTIETPTITLNNPVRTGYEFVGWSGTEIDSSNGKYAQTVTIHKGSTGNRDYTANWKVVEYDIVYDLKGGTAIGNPIKYNINSPTFTLNNPTKAGYEFEAWSGTGITGTGLAYTVTVPSGSTGDRTYTAKWTITTYNIDYDLDGGSVSVPNPKTYNYESSPITLHNPTKPGYDFVGWVTTADVNTTEKPQPIVTISTNSTGDRYYRAVWKQGEYTITYDLDGGEWNEGDIVIDKFNYDTPTFAVPTPVKAGYVFAGWSGTQISGTTKDLVIYENSSGDRAYKANWAESENVITYDLQDGIISGDPNPTSYVTDSGEIYLTNPIKNGYRFAGWVGTGLTKPTLEVVIDTSKGGELNFTATWTPVNYRITYTLGGGKLDSGVTNPTTYNVEAENITLNNPTRTGYTFKGWTGTALEGIQPTVVIVKGSVGARSYTAIWEETVYNITYDYGEGYVEIPNYDTYKFTTPTFTLNNPVCTGCTFIGWSGTGIEDNTMTVAIEKGSLGDKNFVANYSINEYSIKFLGVEGASFTAPADKYTVKSDAIVVPNPAKRGYEFVGWSGTGIVGTQKDLVIASGSYGNRSYTAVFNPINYTVDYNYNSGKVSGINPTTYTIESVDFTVLNPGRAGFSFDGWTKSLVNFTWMNGTINSTGAFVSGSGHWSTPVSIVPGETYTFADGVALAVYDVNGSFVTLADAGTYTAKEGDSYCSVIVAENKTADELAAITVTAENVDSVFVPNGSMGNIKLDANWTSEKFTISYNLNGGTLPEGAVNPTEYTAETEGFSLVNPERTGYIFNGWTGTDLPNTTMNVSVPAGATGNRVYSASWKIERYLLSIELNGGQFTQTVPEFFTVSTPTFSLPIPVKSRHTFAGWLDENGNILPTVTIEMGTIGSLHYVAQWTENPYGSDTHRIYYHGMNNQVIGFQDVLVGEVPTGIKPEQVIGYRFNGWSVSLSDPSVVNSTEDVHIYSNYTVGDNIYNITINGVTKEYTQYATVKVNTAATNSEGSFLYWKDVRTGAVVSYYSSFSFKAHADVNIEAVYGSSSEANDKVAIRITKAEFNDEHDWISFYAERSVAAECKLVQHGIMFTADESIANDSDKFVLRADGVYASSASSTSRSGVYTLSVGGLTKNSGTGYAGCDKLYARAYLIYADANNNQKIIYSDITSYEDGVNMQDNLAKDQGGYYGLY